MTDIPKEVYEAIKPPFDSTLKASVSEQTKLEISRRARLLGIDTSSYLRTMIHVHLYGESVVKTLAHSLIDSVAQSGASVGPGRDQQGGGNV